MSGANHPTPDPNTCDHGVPLHEECDRCWHDHRVRVDSRTSNPSIPVRAGSAFAAKFGREPASAADSAWLNGYAESLTEIERLTHELSIMSTERNQMLEGLEALGWPCRLIELPAHTAKSYREIDRLRAALHSVKTSHHWGHAVQIAVNALNGEQSVPETSDDSGPVTDGQILDQLETALQKLEDGYVCMDMILRDQLAWVLVRFNHHSPSKASAEWDCANSHVRGTDPNCNVCGTPNGSGESR